MNRAKGTKMSGYMHDRSNDLSNTAHGSDRTGGWVGRWTRQRQQSFVLAESRTTNPLSRLSSL
jgi:hypothetical protein